MQIAAGVLLSPESLPNIHAVDTILFMKPNCPDCGVAPKSARFCPGCGRCLRRGLFQSILDWFTGRSDKSEPAGRTVIRRELLSGREFSTKQARREVRAGRLDLDHVTRFRFEGPDGVVREFDSLDEMPPELRKKFEEAHRDLKRGM